MAHFSLAGKKAFITGACSGIGLAVTKRYLEAGARVVMADGQALADQLGALFVRVDVSDEQQVAEGLASAAQRVGKFDILLNNAGIGDLLGPMEESETDRWHRLFNINVFGVYFGLKYGPQQMNDGGSIINTASQAAITMLPDSEPYSATKASVVTMSKTAALELGARGIRVNAVCPGYIDTPMNQDTDEAYALPLVLNPLGRVGTTDDVVGLYHFLAADESSFITGQALLVDGGWTAGVTYRLMELVERGK